MKNVFLVNGNFRLSTLLLSLLAVALAGMIGALFSIHAPTVYSNLMLPSFAPPSWVFAVVWPVLYVLMAVAAYRIRMLALPGKESAAVHAALSDYIVQLVFNVLWSALFFGFGLRTAAFADIIILLFYIAVTTIRFYRLDKTAGWLMVPYLIWVIFAAILNLAVLILN
ncbi:MAG: tryptophan-rich sensory protein [Clostridia bacterium]|nr:tryptophan-rich sensory protein [Clostridia bacterium]